MTWWQDAPLVETAKATAGAWWQDAPLAAEQTMSADDLMIPRPSGSDESKRQQTEIRSRNGVLREDPQGGRFGDALKPVFGGHNPIAETYDTFIEPFVPSKPRTQDEAHRNEMLAKRTAGERVGDAASFAASLPVRIATRGAYGAGDALTGAGFASAGASVHQAEQDFNEANAPQLGALAAAGELGAGTFGATTVRPQAPRVQRTFNPELPAGRAAEASQDLTSFDRLNVRPFGPSFSQGPTAGLAKSLADTPFVGSPVRNALEESIGGASRASEDIAGRFGNAVNDQQAGRAVQTGLERFKDARADDVIDREVGGLSPDQRSQIIRQPARETSLKTKQEALYDEAWDRIPPEMQRGRTREGDTRFLGGLGNTASVLDEIIDRNLGMINRARASRDGNVELTRAGDEVAPVGRQVAVRGGQIPEAALPVLTGPLGRIMRDIASRQWRGTLQDMREIRSEVRRLSSGMSDTEKNTLKKSDIERLRSAVTQDMAYVLERNAERYETGQQGQTAAQIRRAAQLFRRADSFTAGAARRLETIEGLFQASSPESLYRNIVQSSQIKGGNIGKLQTLARTLRADERGELASGILNQLGRPVASARGISQELDFSVNSWLTNWNKMSPEARRAIFGTQHASALDDLSRVASRLANVEAQANVSRSGVHSVNMAGLAAAGGSAATGDLTYVLGAAASGYGAALLLSRPAYARWATSYAQLKARATTGGNAVVAPVHAQIRRLAEMASTDPALVPLVVQIARDNDLDVDPDGSR